MKVMSNILETSQLCKTYTMSKNNEQEVLKNVDLSMKRGEFISLMGPSGSGKSTLLYNISGMDLVTSGKVMFDQQELTGMTQKELTKLRLTKMGFVFQQSHLLGNLCILDNIILSATLLKKESRSSIHKKAMHLMKMTGIEELAYRDITQASGGQLQRVGICRALINNPKMIFGDEPTGALNSKASDEIMNLLAKINEKGTTILLATHDSKVAAKTERILFMLDGTIQAELNLGKYSVNDSNMKEREERVASWLVKMGI